MSEVSSLTANVTLTLNKALITIHGASFDDFAVTSLSKASVFLLHLFSKTMFFLAPRTVRNQF